MDREVVRRRRLLACVARLVSETLTAPVIAAERSLFVLRVQVFGFGGSLIP